MYFKIIFYKCYYAKNLLNSFIILLLLFIFFCCFCCCEPQKCQYGAAAAVNTVSTLLLFTLSVRCLQDSLPLALLQGSDWRFCVLHVASS